jgi:3-keto steroid reductase
LEPQASLDASEGERVKWGSTCDTKLREGVKRTEVDGWGWEGKPVDAEKVRADTAEGVLHMGVGRHKIRDTTEEDVRLFEEQGKECWQEMEKLRGVWEEIAVEKGMLDAQINGKH